MTTKLVVVQGRTVAYTAIMQKPRAAHKTLTSQLKAELQGANLLLKAALEAGSISNQALKGCFWMC